MTEIERLQNELERLTHWEDRLPETDLEVNQAMEIMRLREVLENLLNSINERLQNPIKARILKAFQSAEEILNLKKTRICRNPNHFHADGSPAGHEIGPSCMAETDHEE